MGSQRWVGRLYTQEISKAESQHKNLGNSLNFWKNLKHAHLTFWEKLLMLTLVTFDSILDANSVVLNWNETKLR